MLFILGTKSYTIKNGRIENFACPKCHEKTALDYSIYIRYAYVTLIPLFPVDREIHTACSSCSESMGFNELEKAAQTQIEASTKSKSLKNPLWMYSGLILLICFGIFGIYNFIKTDDNSKVYLKSLKQDDIINLKLSNGYYSTIRIDQVTKDSIVGTSNDYTAYMPYETDEIDKPENYTDSKIKFSKKDLIKLYDEGEINSIKRK